MENKFGKVSRVSICAGKKDGRTILEDVSFTVPYKIMTPFEKENGGIQVMPLCASAGIMSGDLQEFSYQVRQGADLEVLSQSFEKIHKMDGGEAKRNIKVNVEKDSVLYYYPQPVIPFADSAFESTMEIQLEDKSAKLFFLDVISCGRTAHEERFLYRKFASKVTIYRSGKMIYRDNTRYEPEKMPMEKIGLYEGYTHVANLFLSELEDGKVMSEIAERIWEILEMESECDGGVTKLCSGDLAVRIFGYRGQKLAHSFFCGKIKRKTKRSVCRMKIAVLSDTHGLLRPEVLEQIESCDALIHAGDIGSQRIIDEIFIHLKPRVPVYFVRGNNDGAWASHLLKCQRFTLDGVNFCVVHEKKDVPWNLEETQIVIYGHTHKYEEREKGGDLIKK